MALTAGDKLGPYEISGPIGAGGMGEVYRARDTKLRREVALKVLPTAFARDADRMARFEREAQVLASLNHPNIAHIYGLEHAPESPVLVMELVEGESPRGPLPFDEAWKIMEQIAVALEYAHEKGVVHRDLKPANVKATPEGVVKLLDFGLAKAFTGPGSIAQAADDESQTLTLGATEVGVVLGTAAYMAPEQAKGKIVDKRADIWAFGVVFYELLTGERLFKGSDTSDTLAQVLTKDPELARVPAKARRLLKRCLERDPKLRLRDIGEARYLVEDAPSEQSVPTPARPRLSWLAWLVAGVLLVVVGVLTALYLRQQPVERSLLRYTIAAPEGATDMHSFAISPDGRTLVFAAVVDGKRQLWLRTLDALNAQPIPSTEGATYPFWSPDSRSIAFFMQGKLRKIPAAGGPAQTICDAFDGRGGSWSSDDTIVFSPGAAAVDIQKVPAGGGVPTGVTGTKGAYKHPVFLPGGSRFLYLVARADQGKAGIYVASLDGKENRRVLADVSGVVFAPSPGSRAEADRKGSLLFIRENTLMTVPFDAASGNTAGDVSPIVEGVSLTSNNHYIPVTVSDNGILLYESGGAGGRQAQLGWLDRSGKPLEIVGGITRGADPAISPDGKWLAMRRGGNPQGTFWLRDLSRGADQLITTDLSVNAAPAWSPNSDRVVFQSDRSGAAYDLYQRAIGGAGHDELLLKTPNNKIPYQFSRDGRLLIYSENDPKTKWDIWVLPMDSSGPEPKVFLHSDYNEMYAQLSPDGRWLSYTSDESGKPEVWVRSFPAGDSPTKISIEGGSQSRWSSDGKELFLYTEGKIVTVAMTTVAGSKPSLQPGAPHALFDARLSVDDSANAAFEYDLSPDGKRFVISSPGATAVSVPPLTVVTNWDPASKK